VNRNTSFTKRKQAIYKWRCFDFMAEKCKSSATWLNTFLV